MSIAWAPTVDIARALASRLEANARSALAADRSGQWRYARLVAGPGCSRPDAGAELAAVTGHMTDGPNLDHARSVAANLARSGGYVVIVTALPSA